MRAKWLVAGAGALCMQPCLGFGEPPVRSGTPAAFAPLPSATELLARGLALFKERQYEAAIVVFDKAWHAASLSRAHRSHVLLLLGISYYRLDKLDRAEELLQKAVGTGDPQTQASARVFLSRVYADQGAPDRARSELGNVAGSPYLRDTAERLLVQSRPHRLQITLVVSPEYDGNVPLTPLDTDSVSFPAWRTSPRASMDGDVQFLASIAMRPLANGLVLSNIFSYRQQFSLTDYNLLLNSTAIGYSYFGPADRLRLLLSFNFAMLGGDPLFLDGSAKVAYRRRLVGKLGLSATYDIRYRGYLNPDYFALTGLTQGLQVDLGWGLFPQPISIGVGYQGMREQTQAPDPTDPVAQNFRAWAHGPSVWLRARLHRRLELALASSLLQRIFDGGRVDYGSYSDVSLNITLNRFLATFVGGSLIYNSSSDPLFDYVKPTVSAGLAAYLGFL